MSVDINTLTIGSHVLFGGERHEITSIRYYGESYMMELDDNWRNKYSCEALSPIPITEELLTELGFTPKYDEGVELWNKTIKPKEHTDPLTSKYGINMRVFRYCGGWQVETSPSNGLKVDYLHEMEWIIYLTTKQRLI